MIKLLVVTLNSDDEQPFTYAANTTDQAAREFKRLKGDRVNPRAAYAQWERLPGDEHLERCGWRLTAKAVPVPSTPR